MMKTLDELLMQKMKIEIGEKTFEVGVDEDLLKKLLAIPDQFLNLQQDLEEGSLTESEVLENLEEIMDGILGAGAMKATQGKTQITLDDYAAMTIHVVKQITSQFMGT